MKKRFHLLTILFLITSCSSTEVVKNYIENIEKTHEIIKDSVDKEYMEKPSEKEEEKEVVSKYSKVSTNEVYIHEYGLTLEDVEKIKNLGQR